MKWAGREVSLWDGSLPWEFSDAFPWLVETDNGKIEVVIPDWNIENGEWVMIEAGVHLEDLIDDFMQTEIVISNKEEVINRRKIAIAALEQAIESLKTEPLWMQIN